MAGLGEVEVVEEKEGAAAKLRHPSDAHLLVPDSISDLSFLPACNLCCRVLDDGGYSCAICNFHAHKRCAKAPSQIPSHPFHPPHPLSLSHDSLSLTCDACGQTLDRCSSYGCEECGFVLDIHCALLTLPNPEGSSPHPTEGEELRISFTVHDHPLTPYLANREFYWDHSCKCALCLESLNEDVYVCPQPRCKFLIHKRCIRDLYYEDGTRAPRIYHRHKLVTFSAEEEKSKRCGNCRSDISLGEYLGCEECEMFYHRDCLRAPEMVRYPPHPDHTLVLFICPERNIVRCQSCSIAVMEDLCYSCTSCDFLLHVRCGLKTLLYCEEGRAVEIVPSWHEHPLVLCHRANVYLDRCSCCNDTLEGPAYRCKMKGCELVLHEGCSKPSSEIKHPHHPEHPLLLRAKFGEPRPRCNACCMETSALSFSCEICQVYLHVACASQFPSRKHYLHEHDLMRFEEIPSLECNRCDTVTDSPLLRCVPCDFNLHEKCTELPGVVKHKTHHHLLTLRDFFMEDDSGEYYCDLCEKTRDGRLGVYMCLECKMDRPWVFHIECILPELRKVNVKKVRDSVFKKSAEEVARKEEELHALEKKVEETKGELEELRKKHEELSLLKTQREELH